MIRIRLILRHQVEPVFLSEEDFYFYKGSGRYEGDGGRNGPYGRAVYAVPPGRDL